jgi:hypothetical protein
MGEMIDSHFFDKEWRLYYEKDLADGSYNGNWVDDCHDAFEAGFKAGQRDVAFLLIDSTVGGVLGLRKGKEHNG